MVMCVVGVDIGKLWRYHSTWPQAFVYAKSCKGVRLHFYLSYLDPEFLCKGGRSVWGVVWYPIIYSVTQMFQWRLGCNLPAASVKVCQKDGAYMEIPVVSHSIKLEQHSFLCSTVAARSDTSKSAIVCILTLTLCLSSMEPKSVLSMYIRVESVTCVSHQTYHHFFNSKIWTKIPFHLTDKLQK